MRKESCSTKFADFRRHSCYLLNSEKNSPGNHLTSPVTSCCRAREPVVRFQRARDGPTRPRSPLAVAQAIKLISI